jgi:hypothetical protein
MREDCCGYAVHCLSDVVHCESDQGLHVGIGINPNILQRGVESRQDFALEEGMDGRGPIRRPVDGVLRPNFFNVADQVDPLLGRAFLQDTHRILVGRQACWLPSAGLQLELNELGLVLVLRWKALRKQRQNSLERQRIELPSLCRESHLVAIGNLDFFDQFTEKRNG